MEKTISTVLLTESRLPLYSLSPRFYMPQCMTPQSGGSADPGAATLIFPQNFPQYSTFHCPEMPRQSMWPTLYHLASLTHTHTVTHPRLIHRERLIIKLIFQVRPERLLSRHCATKFHSKSASKSHCLSPISAFTVCHFHACE